MSFNSVRHLDAGEGAYFKRQLEFIKTKTYDEVLADLPYAQIFPITSEVPEGATQMTYRSFTSYGFAKLISDYATDFPRVDVGGVEVTVNIKDYGASYAYTIADIKRAAYAKFDLSARKAKAARRAIEETLNSVAFNGDSVAGLSGLIGYSGITEFTIPSTGTGTTKTWSTKTPDQILVDLNGLIQSITIPTFGKESPNTILLPMAQLALLKNTRMGTYNDTTIYEFFTRNNPGIQLIACREMDGTGSGGTDLIFAFEKNADKIAFEVPVPFNQLEEYTEGAEKIIPVMASTAGLIIYRVASCAFGSGI